MHRSAGILWDAEADPEGLVGARSGCHRGRREGVKEWKCSLEMSCFCQFWSVVFEHLGFLSHWAHFTVLRFIFVYVLLHACVVL